MKDTPLAALDWATETLDVIRQAVAKLDKQEGRKNLNELMALHREVLTTEIAKLRKEVALSFYGHESKTSIKDMINIICADYNVTPEQIQSSARKREIAEARQVICWMIRNKAIPNRLTFQAIGNLIGGKNHATVLHSCNAVDDRVRFETEFRSDVKRWCSLLGAVTVYNEVDNKLNVIGYEKVSDKTKGQAEYAED